MHLSTTGMLRSKMISWFWEKSCQRVVETLRSFVPGDIELPPPKHRTLMGRTPGRNRRSNHLRQSRRFLHLRERLTACRWMGNQSN